MQLNSLQFVEEYSIPCNLYTRPCWDWFYDCVTITRALVLWGELFTTLFINCIRVVMCVVILHVYSPTVTTVLHLYSLYNTATGGNVDFEIFCYFQWFFNMEEVGIWVGSKENSCVEWSGLFAETLNWKNWHAESQCNPMVRYWSFKWIICTIFGFDQSLFVSHSIIEL